MLVSLPGRFSSKFKASNEVINPSTPPFRAPIIIRLTIPLLHSPCCIHILSHFMFLPQFHPIPPLTQHTPLQHIRQHIHHPTQESTLKYSNQVVSRTPLKLIRNDSSVFFIDKQMQNYVVLLMKISRTDFLSRLSR